jgi:hypothetical protein
LYTARELPLTSPSSKSCDISDVIIPSWFVSVSPLELEKRLLGSDPGTFFVTQEKPGVFYNLVFVNDYEKVLNATIIMENANNFVLNFDGQEYISDSLLSLLKKMKFLKNFKDPRPFVKIAVADFENARVQLLKFNWSNSDILFKPGLSPMQVIGGSKRIFCTLLAPSCVSYSPSGELAVCDPGNGNCVIIFSDILSVIKKIFLGFIATGIKTPKEGKPIIKENVGKKNGGNDKNSNITSVEGA